MSLGLKLISSLIDDSDGLSKLNELGVDENYFTQAERPVYEHLIEHIKEYGKLPSREAIEELVQLEKADEPPKYYLDKLRGRWIHHKLKGGMLDAQEFLNNGSPNEALDAVITKAMECQIKRNQGKVIDYSKDGARRVLLEHKKQLMLGDDYGVKLGWPTLDSMAGGVSGGDVVSIVGRPASGKTWLMLFIALHAWSQGRVPMFVSMEIKPLQIMQRILSLDVKIPMSNVLKAQLTSKALTAIKDSIVVNKGRAPFYVVDGCLTATVNDVTLMAQQLNPDVVIIDGAYLLRHPNARISRWDKVTDNAETIKRDLAEGLDIPVAISYQLNREAAQRKKQKADLDMIAYTDAIGQLSTLVLALMQDDSIETMRKREVSILKGRNGEVGSFDINWMFTYPDPMNFTEYEEVENMDYL